MKTKLITVCILMAALLAAGALLLNGQQPNIGGIITNNGKKPSIAVIDFRGSGDAQRLMNTFNATLWDELQNSGILTMAAKSIYPLNVPQQPSDFKPPTVSTPARRGEVARAVNNGPWLTDWSGPPVNANYLAFGYTAPQDGRLVLRGWLYNVGHADMATAQVIGKLYFGSLDDAGAKQVARDFATDILQQFGAQSLAGTKIYFISDRSGNKEVWSMDYDGSNQKQLTNYKSISNSPVVSLDGKKFAFSTLAKGTWQLMIHSVETGRRLPFYSPVAPTTTTPEFTPDGKQVLFASSLSGWTQIYISNLDGSGMRRISNVHAIEVSPRVNPKTGSDVLFISGRSGIEQLWHMNLDGADMEMLTPGDGYVSNPAWSPDGKFVAFAWTHGYEPGAYNIFIMDIAKRQPIQLTHNSGRNENPWWAPDGNHIVFSSMRGRSTQLYSMLADGTHVQQLTTQGNNLQPVWAKGIN